MKSKHVIGKVIKFLDPIKQHMVVGEVDSVIHSKTGFEYKIVNDDNYYYVKESEIVSSFTLDKVRKPRSTGKAKSKIVKESSEVQK